MRRKIDHEDCQPPVETKSPEELGFATGKNVEEAMFELERRGLLGSNPECVQGRGWTKKRRLRG